MSETLRILKNRRDRVRVLYQSAVQLDMPSAVLSGIDAVESDLSSSIALLEQPVAGAKKNKRAARVVDASPATEPKRRGRPRKNVKGADVASVVAAGNAAERTAPLPLDAHPLERLAGHELPNANGAVS